MLLQQSQKLDMLRLYQSDFVFQIDCDETQSKPGPPEQKKTEFIWREVRYPSNLTLFATSTDA